MAQLYWTQLKKKNSDGFVPSEKAPVAKSDKTPDQKGVATADGSGVFEPLI